MAQGDLTNMYKYLKAGCRGDQWQDQRQWAQPEIQEVPSEHQEKVFDSEGD